MPYMYKTLTCNFLGKNLYVSHVSGIYTMVFFSIQSLSLFCIFWEDNVYIIVTIFKTLIFLCILIYYFIGKKHGYSIYALFNWSHLINCSQGSFQSCTGEFIPYYYHAIYQHYYYYFPWMFIFIASVVDSTASKCLVSESVFINKQVNILKRVLYVHTIRLKEGCLHTV